jgi:hypothetical protein
MKVETWKPGNIPSKLGESISGQTNSRELAPNVEPFEGDPERRALESRRQMSDILREIQRAKLWRAGARCLRDIQRGEPCRAGGI